MVSTPPPSYLDNVMYFLNLIFIQENFWFHQNSVHEVPTIITACCCFQMIKWINSALLIMTIMIKTAASLITTLLHRIIIGLPPPNLLPAAPAVLNRSRFKLTSLELAHPISPTSIDVMAFASSLWMAAILLVIPFQRQSPASRIRSSASL